MKRHLKTSVVFLLAAGASAFFNPSVSRADESSRVYEWMKKQQQSHGILGNQDNDDFAGLYPNALAALCYVHQKDFDRAKRVFDFYQGHFAECFAPGTNGGFPQFANARTGELDKQADQWIGDNAWLLIALNAYHAATNDGTYDEMRAGIAKWLISLQDPGGGVRAGFNRNGPMNHYSTEGNLDCVVALVDYPEAQAKVRKFLTNDMWVDADKRFKMGSTVEESALDTCAWAVATLGKEYASTFKYTESKFVRTDKCTGSGKEMTGYADDLGKNRIWLEGTGEMAVAYNVAGDHAKAKSILAELEKAMIASPAHPGLVAIPCHSSDPSWANGSEVGFVPSQAWYLYAAWNYNPMATERK